MTQQPAAETKKEKPEFGRSYYAYAGKLENRDGKLVDAFMEVTKEGERIAPETGEWLVSKFNYAKRPRLGGIYEVIWAKPEQKSFYIMPDHHAFMGTMPLDVVRGWELEDRQAKALDARRKQMNKELQKEVLAKMTLDELRAKMRTASSAQRVVLLSIMIEFVNK